MYFLIIHPFKKDNWLEIEKEVKNSVKQKSLKKDINLAINSYIENMKEPIKVSDFIALLKKSTIPDYLETMQTLNNSKNSVKKSKVKVDL